MNHSVVAAILVLLYLVMSWYCLRGTGRGRRSPDSSGDHAPVVLAYASQSGTAESLARRYAASLAIEPAPPVLALNELTDALMTQARKVLFFVSTYGEGEPPDNGQRFQRYWSTRSPSAMLAHLEVAVLAMGDSQYRHFCGFGQRVQQLMEAQGARLLFPTVRVDRCDEAALQRWQQRLAVQQLLREPSPSDASQLLAEADSLPISDWQLVAKRCLNTGSPGQPLYLLTMKPCGDLPHWQAGDIVRVHPFNDPDVPYREYSIASVPEDGTLELIVRLGLRDDGSPGVCSDWLINALDDDSVLSLQIRHNPSFHADENTAPMILIGNGSGLAGLLAHLRAKYYAGRSGHCLFYGERKADYDRPFDHQLKCWLKEGHLALLERTFSRDEPAHYVQDALLAQADDLRARVEAGASIYVCGSRLGMARGVDAALRDVLGEEGLENLAAAGRYRRDIY